MDKIRVRRLKKTVSPKLPRKTHFLQFAKNGVITKLLLLLMNHFNLEIFFCDCAEIIYAINLFVFLKKKKIYVLTIYKKHPKTMSIDFDLSKTSFSVKDTNPIREEIIENEDGSVTKARTREIIDSTGKKIRTEINRYVILKMRFKIDL